MSNADRLPLSLILSVAAQRATTADHHAYIESYRQTLAALEAAYSAPSAAQ